MTDRDELIEAARNAADSDLYSPSLLLRILDAVEPIIRADEATDAWAKAGAAAVSEYRRDLRAKVKALRHENECDWTRGRVRPETGIAECNCLRADVLALLDEEATP
jgi:hypothetical protein